MIISFCELQGVCHEIHAFSSVTVHQLVCYSVTPSSSFPSFLGGFEYVDFKLKESLSQNSKLYHHSARTSMYVEAKRIKYTP